MTRLNDDANARRYSVEDALAELVAVVYFLEDDMLRVQQAIRRAGLDDLLNPVLANHAEILENLKNVQSGLQQVWTDGQGTRWAFSIQDTVTYSDCDA